MDDDVRVELALSNDTAMWLYIEMGRRPHDEGASREIWHALHRELYGEEVPGTTPLERAS